MKPISNLQIAAFHALLKQHSITDQKADIVQQLSNGRATSTKDLYAEEIQQWIDAMNSNKKFVPAAKDPRQKMFNQIIAAAHEMGYIQPYTVVENGKLKTKKQYDRLHDWVNKYGYLKKPLNDYTYEELPTLVTAFKNVYSTWLRKFH